MIELSDFPKIHCPFRRKIFKVDINDWKKYGKELGLRSPEVYLAVNEINPGYEWVFEDEDTICTEKLNGCLYYDVPILTNVGPIQVGEIVNQRLNVEVLSYNFNKGISEFKRINNYYKKKNLNGFLCITFKINSTNKQLVVTPNHRFWTESGWKRIDLLRNGTYIFFGGEKNLIKTKITNIESLSKSRLLLDCKYQYDLEIDSNSNYFANGILVHNSNIKILTRNGRLEAVQNRKNIIDPLQIMKMKGKTFIMEGIFQAIGKGYIKPNGEQCGELIGPKLQKNPYKLSTHLWYPFEKCIKHLTYRSFYEHDRTFDNWRSWFKDYLISRFASKQGNKDIMAEGVVFYNLRRKAEKKTYMAKLRRNMFDFFYDDKIKIYM